MLRTATSRTRPWRRSAASSSASWCCTAKPRWSAPPDSGAAAAGPRPCSRQRQRAGSRPARGGETARAQAGGRRVAERHGLPLRREALRRGLLLGGARGLGGGLESVVTKRRRAAAAARPDPARQRGAEAYDGTPP